MYFLFVSHAFLICFTVGFQKTDAQMQFNTRHRSNFNHNTNTTTTIRTPTGNEELLNRIYDQVLTTYNVDERQHQKLETLENILERFEIKNRDQLDAIRNDIKELGRRMQNLDYTAARSEGNLNQLRSDVDALRHNMDSNQNSNNIGKRDQQSATASATDLECSEKLEALATLLTSTRSAVHRLEKQTNAINGNVTNILLASREISQRQYGLPTKQYLHSALNSIRTQVSPYSSIMQYPAGNFNTNNMPPLPPSCSHAATSSSGIHKIQTALTKESFYVMCDNDIEEGGWTVIQNRQDGTINFHRNWLEYKFGFGNLAGEFFIGLDKLHDITSSMLHELLIVLEDFDGTRRIARYKQFAIAGEKEDYALRLLGEYEGTAGDSFSYSASYKFSTFDNDNDGWVEGNCAASHTGAWWYNACEMSNLNGQYLGGELTDANQFQGVYWNDFHGSKYSLKSARMMIRPIDRIFLQDFN